VSHHKKWKEERDCEICYKRYQVQSDNNNFLITYKPYSLFLTYVFRIAHFVVIEESNLCGNVPKRSGLRIAHLDVSIFRNADGERA